MLLFIITSILPTTNSKVSTEDVFKILADENDTTGALNGLNISNGNTLYNNVSASIPVLMKIYVWTITSAFCVGILGNLLVLIVYLKNFTGITPFKFLISHLAVCDSLFSLTQIFNVAFNNWYTGKVLNSKLCKLIRGSSQLSSLVSLGAILAIVVERFTATRKGIMSNTPGNTWKKIVTGVCLTWIMALSSDIPIFMSTVIVNERCQDDWKEYFGKEFGKVYSIYLLLAFCLIPMAAIGLMNGMMILETKKAVKSSISYYSILENMERKRKDMQVVKVLVAITTVFFVCILPTRIMFAVSSFSGAESLEKTDTWSFAYTLKLLYSLHVAVNPVIYGIIDKAFRNEVLRIIFCCEVKEAENDTSSLTSESSSPLISLKQGMDEKVNDLEDYDLLTITATLEGTLLLFHQHRKTKEEEKCFQRETII